MTGLHPDPDLGCASGVFINDSIKKHRFLRNGVFFLLIKRSLLLRRSW